MITNMLFFALFVCFFGFSFGLGNIYGYKKGMNDGTLGLKNVFQKLMGDDKNVNN